MLLKYLELCRVLVPLGGHGWPAKCSTTRRTEPGLGISWWILLPWTHPRMEAREDKVQMQEECCIPPYSASGQSSWTGVGRSGFGYLLQNQAWPEEGLWMAGGAAGQSWGLGLADGGRGLTYVHIRLLRTSGGPRCSRSRGRGGDRRPQPLCSCPPAAGHTSCSTRSHP